MDYRTQIQFITVLGEPPIFSIGGYHIPIPTVGQNVWIPEAEGIERLARVSFVEIAYLRRGCRVEVLVYPLDIERENEGAIL